MGLVITLGFFRGAWCFHPGVEAAKKEKGSKAQADDDDLDAVLEEFTTQAGPFFHFCFRRSFKEA